MPTPNDLSTRPIPPTLLAARGEVLAAVEVLRSIPDAALTREWTWKGGSEEEVRYGFYRVAESFELAGIEAASLIRRAGLDRGRAAERIAPATAARWDLHGLLLPLDEATWDADPAGEEWTIRQTLGHVIASQRGYLVGTVWWESQGLPADAPDLPYAPEDIFEVLPSDEAEGEGSRTAVRERLDALLDEATEQLAGLTEDRLAVAARWSGFPVDVGFRLGRWSSHIREHTIQVEKTLVMLGHSPAEVDRLVRHVLAAWGRAEAVVYGFASADDAVRVLAAAASAARPTAEEIAAIAG